MTHSYPRAALCALGAIVALGSSCTDAPPDGGLDGSVPPRDAGAIDALFEDGAPRDARPVGDAGRVTGSPLRAFPSALGYGRDVAGGRGGEVRRVTTLADDGPGSLRDAWERPGPAYIVFDVAGYVVTNTEIHPADDKTVFGQSAFRSGGGGITLRTAGTSREPLVSGAFGHQALRYLRLRRGAGVPGETSGDNMEPYQGDGNIIIDHCSFSWSTDENLSFGESSTHTVQYSIIAEGLMFATHAYSTPSSPMYMNAPHSMGSLNAYDETDMSWFGNFFAHNNQRNALFSQLTLPVTRIEFVNNIGYNWGAFGNVYESADGTDLLVNVIGNVGRRGADSSAIRYYFCIPTGSSRSTHRFFFEGNLTEHRMALSDPEWNAVGDRTCNDPADTRLRAASAFDGPLFTGAPIVSADVLPDAILPHVGASLLRDAVDTRLVSSFRDGTGRLIDSPDEVGGYPSLASIGALRDADHDGMDDDWETEHGVTAPNDVLDTYTINGTRWDNPGYEAIEVYYFTAMDLSALGL